jgi:hypothetical protein
MIERLTLRRPKMHFDVAGSASHVTFDDGRSLRRNLPWIDFVEARWTYDTPDSIAVEIGGWLVEIRGHNLDPLFAAVEEQTLLRVRARPELDGDTGNLPDTFATAIQFSKVVVAPVPRRHGQLEIDLGT